MDGAAIVDFSAALIHGCANFFMLGRLHSELVKNLIDQVEGQESEIQGFSDCAG